MKYGKLKITRLAAIAVFLLTAGCSGEPGNGGGQGTVVPGEDVTVFMTLNVPGAASTRGLTSEQEKAVRTIDVLVFDSNLELSDRKPGQLDNSPGGMSFSVILKASENDNDKFRIMALANVRHITHSIFEGAELGGHKGKGYDEIRAMLQAAVPSRSDLASKGIPMWGELKDMVLLAGTDNSYEMNLLRSLARIDIGTNPDPVFAGTGQITGWAALDNFSLEEVYVYNGNSYYALSPDRNNYNFASTKVSAISLPRATGKNSSPVLYSDALMPGTVTRDEGKGIGVTADIYTGEADVKMGTSGAYGDGNHAGRMAMVAAGYYSPDPRTPNTTVLSYYRLDFLEGVNGTVLMDILRNNNYQVVIRSVSGPGSGTKEEAFEQFDTDIVAAVNSWSDPKQGGTTIDGDYYLRVNPYDFELDKWARADEEITIETNVSETNGASWSATVEKYADTDPAPTWLTITPGTGSGRNGGVLKFNLEQVPATFTEPDSRSARLRISAGTMVHDIIVTQTGRDSEHLLRLSHSELVFAGRKWDETGRQWVDPDPQTITVNWNPRRWPYYLDLTDYTGGGVDMATVIPDENNTPALTVSPAAIGDDNRYLAANPFFERSSRLAFTAKNTDGTGSITKRILIRQIYYSLVVGGTKDYYFQGNTYTLNIRSNSPWTATFGGDESIFASCSGTSGAGNTSSGENLTFTIAPSAKPDTRATVTFSSPDNLFPPQTFNIIAQDELPNCYVIPPNDYRYIPIRKAYRVWKLDRDLYNDSGNTLPSGTQEAVLLWQDTPGLIPSVSFSKIGNEVHIFVPAAYGKQGNAVVALTIDGKIYWSWHIWVTNDNPENTAYQEQANGYTFMDRNLGASGTGGYEAFGLYYEGGRKDPFPPTAAATGNVRKTVYDIKNNVLEYNQAGGITTVSAPPYDGLPESIRNPMDYLYGAYGNTHWHGLLYDATRTDLWENGIYKSDYDPCPKGWRVATEASLSGMSGLNQGIGSGSGGFLWNGMWFPTQWQLNFANGLVSGTTTAEFALWYTRTRGTPLMLVNSTTERGSNSRQCNGAPVRCVKY